MKLRRAPIDPLADLRILVWYRLGPKQTVANDRLFVPGEDGLEGDEKVYGEDSVDSLFSRHEVLPLIDYLTHHDQFGSRHIVTRAADPCLRQLRGLAEKPGDEGPELSAYGDWHQPFDVHNVAVDAALTPSQRTTSSCPQILSSQSANSAME